MSDRIGTGRVAVSELTLDEKCALVAGTDLWHLPAIERLGIAALKVSDGPSGVRGERWTGRPSALFPCGSALGATWDPPLVERIGAALGAEARDRGVHVVLAPTVNLQRTPIGGRNLSKNLADSDCFPITSAILARFTPGPCACASGQAKLPMRWFQGWKRCS